MKQYNIENYLVVSDKRCVDLMIDDVGFPTKYVHNQYVYWDNGSTVTLVAHVDTCKRSKNLLIDNNGYVVKALNSILGADDRAGVYAISKIANSKIAKCNILLTFGEEVGGIGVKKFIDDHEYLPFKEEQNLFIELDRQGANEYVVYSELSEELRQWTESYGWNECYGSYSDVADLTDAYGVPHINLSVGYYNQHTKSEYLVLSVLENTISRVVDMLSKYIPTFPLVEEVPYNYLDDSLDIYKDDVIILDNGREMKLKDYYKDCGWYC